MSMGGTSINKRSAKMVAGGSIRFELSKKDNDLKKYTATAASQQIISLHTQLACTPI